MKHASLRYPSLSLGVCSNSCPLSWWCYITVSSSVALFFFCLQSFPASKSFPINAYIYTYSYVIYIFNYIFNAHHYTKRWNEKNLDFYIESPWNNSYINRLRAMCWLLGDSNPGAELHWYCDFPKQWTPLCKMLIEIKCDFPSVFIGIWEIFNTY